MRGFILGLVVGTAFGAGGLYLALEKPWGHVESLAALVPDAGVMQAQGRAGRRRHRRRHHRHRRPGEAAQGVEPLIELSAAHRRPVWRGPEVSLPARDMDFSSGGGGRSLNQSEINAGIASGKRAVIRCIADARGNAELRASIKLRFLVEANGRVSKLKVRAPSYLMEHGLYSCVKGAVGSMHFSSTGAPTVVRVPFDLS